MAKIKYRVSCRVGTSRQWHNAPMKSSHPEALEAYRDWDKRPEDPVALIAARRNEDGEWSILDDTEFGEFKDTCKELWGSEKDRMTGLPEVTAILRYQ